MNRRDFLTLWLQALLLALFPWLRTERGIAVAARAAEAMVLETEHRIFSVGMVGYELTPELNAFLHELAAS